LGDTLWNTNGIYDLQEGYCTCSGCPSHLQAEVRNSSAQSMITKLELINRKPEINIQRRDVWTYAEPELAAD
jgi:hypothetical protein